MVEPSSLGHFLIKQAVSQTVTGYFGAGKFWSNSLRIFFEKPITLLETNRHNTWKWRVGIPFFWDSLFSWANCLLDFRECRILWAERDDFFLSFKGSAASNTIWKKTDHIPPTIADTFFCRFGFSSLPGNWQLKMIPLWPVIQISNEDKPGFIRVIVRNYTLSMDI